MFKRLLSLSLATILCSSMLSITAVAEETKIEKHNHMYEFPFKCEFWIDRPNNLGSYFKELDMSCGVDIDEYGKITYTYYSMEDFQFNERYERAYSDYIAIPVSYDLPYWYDCNKYFWDSTSELTEYDVQKYIYNINYEQSSYFGVYHNSYYNYDNDNDDRNTAQYIKLSTKYYDKLLYVRLTKDSSGSILNIHNDDIIAKATISPVSRIFKDEQGDMFIRDGEEKNYFMDDVSVTINGHKISKTIGTVEVKYNIIAPIEGDVNCDGEVNITDVVLLQKWLLAVPNTHLENWQAVDLCKDNRLDVFDLCLLKRKLIEQHNN